MTTRKPRSSPRPSKPERGRPAPSGSGPPSGRTTRETTKVAVLSCTHAPFTDQAAWDWAIETLKIFKPDVLVHLGDWIDTSPVASYPNEDHHSQSDEYSMAAEQSAQLRDVVGPRCRLVRLEGNHESRLGENRRNVNPRLRDSLHWSYHPELGPEWKHWESLPYCKDERGIFRVGDIVCYHGFDCGNKSDELEGLQMNWMIGAPSRVLLVRGHTHKPIPITQVKRTEKVLLPYWYTNVGHLGPARPSWMHNKDTSQWGNAMLLARTGAQGSGWSGELVERKPSGH